MDRKPGAREKRSQPHDPETIYNIAGGFGRNKRQRLESNTSLAPGASDTHSQCAGWEEETFACTVITYIRATGVASGLQHVPAWFYIIVCHSGLKWRTEDKRLSMNDDVEWNGSIPIPSDLSAIVCLEVYASFEFNPTLNAGEQPQKLTITVRHLLNNSENHIPFTFFPTDCNSVSPCSSILMIVKTSNERRSRASMSGVLGSLWIADSPKKSEGMPNRGYNTSSRYQKHGGKRDLERSAAEFEWAFGTCPPNHACRAATQPNPATAKFVPCQVEDTNTALAIPPSLGPRVPATRLVGHADYLSVFQSTTVQSAGFEKQRDKVDGTRARALLQDMMGLSSTGGSESQAVSLPQLRVNHGVDARRRRERSSVQLHSESRLTNGDTRLLGAQLLERFGRYGDPADLHQAITLLQKVAGSGDDENHTGLENLGGALVCRFERFGRMGDLGDAILTLKAAVDLTPDRHPNKASRLDILGILFRTRFTRLGDPSDLENAISALRAAVDLTPHGHLYQPGRLNGLGISLMTRFKFLGELSDLEDAISRLSDAVDLTPYGHVHKPGRLSSLGNSFITRFKRFGELSDLENAISIFRVIVDLTPHDHLYEPDRLNCLGRCLSARFKCLGELRDLEDAISRFRVTVDLTLHGHPHKTGFLSSLGNSLVARFEHLGELSDLEDAISTLKAAADLTPYDHPHTPGLLHRLGNSFITRFNRLGELSDLADAISTLRVAVDCTPHSHPDKAGRLNSLGIFFRARFNYFGGVSDLEDAILTLRVAVDLTPHDHPHRPGRLSSLGVSFVSRFEYLGELSDLDDAILVLRAAVDLTPDGHLDKPSRLNSLGVSLRTRFDCLGQLSNLQDAISTFKAAIDLTPHDHPHKPSRLNCLGNCLGARFRRLGELRDLEDAISRLRVAVDLTFHGHHHKPDYLNNLGKFFRARFEHLGELNDLEDAISTLKLAVNLIPYGHPDKPGCLTSLGIFFVTRFEHLRELRDLEDAISTLKDAVDLTPHDHLDKPGRLNSLGISFRARFNCLGELSDLEDVISTLKIAVDLAPHSHPHTPGCLNNLGISFVTRFEHLGKLSDLEDAISTFRDAVDLTPHGHPHRPCRLDNLGNSFRARFERLGKLRDLEDAISTLKVAVSLIPHDHPHRPSMLNNFGNCLRARFKRLGELDDINNAISTLRVAVDLTPHGHPHKPSILSNLGNSFRARFERLQEQHDLEEAISVYSRAASVPVGPICSRFHASQQWISSARLMKHHSLLHAYSVAVNLLPQLACMGLSRTYRFARLRKSSHVVREAAAAALDSGFPELAVEWLEQGRSIVWRDLFQPRSSYGGLSYVHPDHARRLRELSAALQHTGATRENPLFVLSDSIDHAMHCRAQTLQQDVDRHRTLAIERQQLLQEIRRFPGFERFLLRKDFSELRASAHSGPVVILNAAERRCDALIVLADVDHVIHVPLPNFTFQRSTYLRSRLRSYLHHALVERDSEKASWDCGGWQSLLSLLWKCVVKPIMDALAFSVPGNLSRIFWCPTGPFVSLPIHAAGLYGAEYSVPGHKIFDFVVSSYVPTLGLLAPSRNVRAAPNREFRLLAVRQAPRSRLPGAHVELEYIQEVIRNSAPARITFLESSVGTAEEVLRLMKEADWVHFACHGVQDTESPTASGLCLGPGRRLKISDMIGLSRCGGLAFLSACQTAMCDEDLSDEAIHITAGMLFAGYGGAIGTMWSISDRLAPIVARDVYEYLFRNGTMPDYQEAAHALHEAIGHLREDGEVSFTDWVPFIHVGL